MGHRQILGATPREGAVRVKLEDQYRIPAGVVTYVCGWERRASEFKPPKFAVQETTARFTDPEDEEPIRTFQNKAWIIPSQGQPFMIPPPPWKYPPPVDDEPVIVAKPPPEVEPPVALPDFRAPTCPPPDKPPSETDLPKIHISIPQRMDRADWPNAHTPENRPDTSLHCTLCHAGGCGYVKPPTAVVNGGRSLGKDAQPAASIPAIKASTRSVGSQWGPAGGHNSRRQKGRGDQSRSSESEGSVVAESSNSKDIFPHESLPVVKKLKRRKMFPAQFGSPPLYE